MPRSLRDRETSYEFFRISLCQRNDNCAGRFRFFVTNHNVFMRVTPAASERLQTRRYPCFGKRGDCLVGPNAACFVKSTHAWSRARPQATIPPTLILRVSNGPLPTGRSTSMKARCVSMMILGVISLFLLSKGISLRATVVAVCRSMRRSWSAGPFPNLLSELLRGWRSAHVGPSRSGGCRNHATRFAGFP